MTKDLSRVYSIFNIIRILNLQSLGKDPRNKKHNQITALGKAWVSRLLVSSDKILISLYVFFYLQ